MTVPGFVGSLKQELEGVLPQFRAEVKRVGGLSEEELLALTSRPDADPAMYHPEHANAVNVIDAEKCITAEHVEVGEQALLDGSTALVILAGGHGTRIGGSKALLTLPNLGLSLLAWQLLQAGNMPVWVMASRGLDQQIQRHVTSLALPVGLNGVIFPQFVSYRLTPDNRLSPGASPGIPDLYPLGHVDVGPALMESGILNYNPQVKRVIIINVDNVMAAPHAGVLGRHIVDGNKLTCEVVDRVKGDRGGVLAWVDNHLQIAEDFRLPEGFVEAALFHNTNTMVIDAEVLRWPIPWRWHRVAKNLGSRVVIQYERLLQQYAEECQAEFIRVPREARYLPIKTPEDLESVGRKLTQYRFDPTKNY